MSLTTILCILLGVILVITTVLALRYFTHMLQLSSYQFQGYFRFLRTHLQLRGLHTGTAVMLACAGAFRYMNNHHHRLFWVVALVFAIFLLLQYIPKPAKKKFVVTKRVSRLFVTYAVITCILAVVSCLTVAHHPRKGIVFFTLVWALYIFLLPEFVALCNFINQPIEKAVNNYYINDAKRLLKEHGNLRVIGVTGSYGKTSVKYYLNTLLSEQFRVLMTPESFNTPMGVVRTIRGELKPVHQIFICEMGARHVGDIKEICDIVHPDDGIITSIGPQHLETFHTQEAVVGTKYELFDAVAQKELQEGAATGKHLKWINGDNEVIRSFTDYREKHKEAITYGVSEDVKYRATDISVSKNGTAFTVTTPAGESEQFQTKLVGGHNVENIVGAIAVASSLGIPLAKLKGAVRRLQPVPHRLELKRHGSVSILDDAYNSNPMGAKAAVETLGLFTDSVRILVTPGMVELGEKQDAYNKEFGSQAAKACDYIILVGDQAKPIAEGAKEAGFDPERIFLKSNLREATALMYEIDAGKEKVILLENDLPDNYNA